MHVPDIPQNEVQRSMARIREAASKTQETPAKFLNKELARLASWIQNKVASLPFFFLIIFFILSTSFRQILDTFRRNISLDQLSISTKRYIRPVVLFDQMSYSTKCISMNCRGSSNITSTTWTDITTQAYLDYKQTLSLKFHFFIRYLLIYNNIYIYS